MSEGQGLVPARPVGNIFCGATCSWTDRTLIESGGFYSRWRPLAGGAAAVLRPGVPIPLPLLRSELRGWVQPVRALAEQAEHVHVLMNNCYRDYAVRNARQLAGLLAQPRGGMRAS